MTAPAAPIFMWNSNAFDHTPNFIFQLPTGLGNATDAAEGDVLHTEYQATGGNWSGAVPYINKTLTAGNMVDGASDSIAASLINPGVYDFRCRLQRAGENSPWSSTVLVTLTAPSGAIKTFRGGFHTFSGSSLSSSIDIGTAAANRLVVVGFYASVGASGDAPPTVTVNGVALTIPAGSLLDADFCHNTGFAYGVVAAGDGSQNVTVTFGSANAGQPAGFFVWTVTSLASNVPRDSCSQLFTSLAVGTPPSQLTVNAGDFVFAVAYQSTGSGNFQPSLPPADHDPTTDVTMKDNVFQISIAGDWEIGIDGSMTIATDNNASSQRSGISFA